ncbi:MAG: preprotein translocase subunit YajC [Firmicutes bacterium]|nr:preprotein translocase subunit YajC [Bacillota bacterium]
MFENLGNYGTFIYLGVLVAVFYFFLIRPQQKQQKARVEMLSKLNKGDKIINHGGIIGTITEIKEDSLTVRIADKTEVSMLREGVARVLSK